MGHMGESGLKQLVVDRCFIENGERWIIDYKSTRLPEQADEAEIRKAASSFAAQLEGYAALFAAEGLPVRKAIYFMTLGKLSELL